MPKAKVRAKLQKGFAVMRPELVSRIAQKGGQTISCNRLHMAEIGRIGGEQSQRNRRRLVAQAKRAAKGGK